MLSKKIYLLIFFGMVISLAVGVLVGMYIKPVKQVAPEIKDSTEQFYATQMATVRGRITNVTGQTLTVKNVNNVSADLKASSNIQIVKFSSNSRNIASPSSALSDVELNKDVLLNLQLVNGEYQILQIQYISPAPSIPPLENP